MGREGKSPFSDLNLAAADQREFHCHLITPKETLAKMTQRAEMSLITCK